MSREDNVRQRPTTRQMPGWHPDDLRLATNEALWVEYQLGLELMTRQEQEKEALDAYQDFIQNDGCFSC